MICSEKIGKGARNRFWICLSGVESLSPSQRRIKGLQRIHSVALFGFRYLATKDEDGYFWLQGRSDDVLNIAGHRIGTAEIESTLVSHKWVAEAAAVGIPDTIRGEVAKVFVTLRKACRKKRTSL